MQARTLRKKFIEFFKEKGHKEIPQTSLIPENDPTVLFTTAGMQPLGPYFLGEKHPEGKRLMNIQRCLRTGDIDDVGDICHLTFFEMLGSWSLGDYFKTQAIRWSFEFLTDKKWLGLDPKRLYATVFKEDKNIPQDKESIKIWKEQFKKAGINAEVYPGSKPIKGNENYRIFPLKKDNWWGLTTGGPCGPSTEMFYDLNPKKGPLQKTFLKEIDEGRLVEIWNDVFMEFNKLPNGVLQKLAQKNVDTGMGLERTIASLQEKRSVFETELFSNVIKKIEKLSKRKYKEEENQRPMRIIADHIRASVFLIMDNVIPSNTEQGYILRRLIRRIVRYGRKLGIEKKLTSELARVVISDYKDFYPDLEKKKEKIISELNKEEERFKQTLEKGLKEFEKILERLKGKKLSGEDAFYLYETYGFPIELTKEIAKERNISVNLKGFLTAKKRHQELSRKGAEKKFAGGLAGKSRKTIKLHTATHLLHQALREILGNHIQQKGSNITPERLRFDFSHPEKMTDEQIKKVEEIVNQKIKENLPVRMKIMSLKAAEKSGALALFKEKYKDKVKVYFIGNFSKEVCGGPHVKKTGELKSFKIIKEESVGAGVRRIKAVVED